MSRSFLFRSFTGFVLLAFGVASASANSAPVVTNVTALQRSDGSKIVDIRYDLADAEGDAITVTLQASNNAGSTWTVPITAVSGAVQHIPRCCSQSKQALGERILRRQ